VDRINGRRHRGRQQRSQGLQSAALALLLSTADRRTTARGWNTPSDHPDRTAHRPYLLRTDRGARQSAEPGSPPRRRVFQLTFRAMNPEMSSSQACSVISNSAGTVWRCGRGCGAAGCGRCRLWRRPIPSERSQDGLARRFGGRLGVHCGGLRADRRTVVRHSARLRRGARRCACGRGFGSRSRCAASPPRCPACGRDGRPAMVRRRTR
jgi:hypothetical protein